MMAGKSSAHHAYGSPGSDYGQIVEHSVHGDAAHFTVEQQGTTSPSPIPMGMIPAT